MAFIIYSLPRSRSAWLAHYLNYPMAVPLQPVGHNIVVDCKDLDAFVRAYKEQGMFGTVEVEAVRGWQVIREALPDLKVVVIRRPLVEVARSLHEFAGKYVFDLSEMAKTDVMLDALGSVKGVHSLKYEDLQTEAACRWLFEYCLELEFDYDWWRQLSMLNIQVDMQSAVEHIEENKEQIEGFFADLQRRTEGLTSCPLN